MKNVTKSLTAVPLLALVCGCAAEPAKNEEPKIVSGVCHAADYVPPCKGSAPDRLGSASLGTNFFKDVFVETELAGVYGRRVNFADLNGDRYPEILAIRTGVTPGLQQLLMNVPRDGEPGRRFMLATTSSGIFAARDGGYQTALMSTFGDVDNDGDLDLFSGSYSQKPQGEGYVDDPNEIYLNDGTGVFTLQTSSGIDDPWPLTTAGAAFFDYDHDGLLDLFVGNFMKNYPTLTSYQDELYRGLGGGAFERVTETTGILTLESVGDESAMYPKPTYGVTVCDWNDDGWGDVLTSTYALGWNDLWKNEKDGTFKNVGVKSKYYMDDEDHPEESTFRDGGNSFSASCGDYDNDGDLDVFDATTTHGDYPRNRADRSRILVNRGKSHDYVFDRPDLQETGVFRSLNGSGDDGNYGNEGDHGSTWADLDNDGLLDLIIEASAYPNSHAWIYHQLPGHTFENVTPDSGVAANLVNTNGMTVDDYDRDGDLDVLFGSVNTGNQQAPGGVEQLHLMENVVGNTKGAFLYVTLVGTEANRMGVGARVKVTAGCLTQTREIQAGKGTFGAQDPAYAFFGLGDVDRVDELEIRWPTNPPHVERFYNLEVNRFLQVTEGSPDLSCE